MTLTRKTTAAALAIAISFCLAPRAHAAEATRERISFKEALSLALSHNRVLRAAELSSAAAGHDVGVARGAMLPRLDALENYSNTNTPALVFANLLNQQDFGPNDFHIDRLNYPASF